MAETESWFHNHSKSTVLVGEIIIHHLFLLGYRGIMDHNPTLAVPRLRIVRRAVQLRCAVGRDVEFQWCRPLSPQQLLTLEDGKLALFGLGSEEPMNSSLDTKKIFEIVVSTDISYRSKLYLIVLHG